MVEFKSSSTRMVNSSRAITECIEAALGENNNDCDVLIIHSSLGHNFQQLTDTARELLPNARILGSSCCGVIGSEGVSESMKDVAIMAIKGKEELAIASCNDIYSHNAFEKSAELARNLKSQNPNINMVHFLASGIDINDQACIDGIQSVLGESVTIFGATSADNMRGVISFQIVDEHVYEHGAWAVGYADPTLKVDTQATHGFIAVGKPMIVTKSKNNVIYELDGKPAWETYTERLELPVEAHCGDTIPVGALAEKLPDDLAKEYGNDHILRVVTKKDEDGAMYYATTCPEGTELWITIRDEERIFSDMDRLIESMILRLNGRKPVAVFHADCLARGRFLFNKVMKEELVGQMQYPLSTDGEIPPWLGMYGFGEFARLGGKNYYHNYSSAIYALYRDA